jgi:hypothetical protein
MRDSYELLLSNTRQTPETQITIINESHSSIGLLTECPKSKLQIVSM